MELTLQEVLVRALKKLEDLSFQRFIEKLSVWDVREGYRNIPNDELTGKDPEHVAGLISEYYRYAYGAELTLAVLEDIDEKKVREELQQDLREVDISGHGLGTIMFTDKVNFIDNHRSDLKRSVIYVDLVLNYLRDQDLLTLEQYSDVLRTETFEERIEDICAKIRNLEDTGKYTAYTVLKEHNERLIQGLEEGDIKWGDLLPRVTGHFVIRNKSHLTNNIKKVSPVIDDLRSDHLLTEEQYKEFQALTAPKDKMERLCDIFKVKSDRVKDQFYISLWRYNYRVINDLEKSDKKTKSEKSLSSFNPGTSQSLDFSHVEESKEVPELSDSAEATMTKSHNQELTENIKHVLPVMGASSALEEPEEDGKQHQKPPNLDLSMGLTLQEVLIKTLKKLEESSFQTFIKNLSVWEAREEYKNIPKDKLTRKDPEHVVGLINEYYKYAYGAEVTLSILEDIDEKKVREELQQDLREVDVLGQGLGTRMFTDRVTFIYSDVLDAMMELIHRDSVLHDLQDQDLLTPDQYNDVDEKEIREDLYDIIRTWKDTGKYTAYTVLRKHPDELIYKLGLDSWITNDWLNCIGLHHFVVQHKDHLISTIKEVNPVVEDLRSNHLLTKKQYEELQVMTTPEEQMRLLCSIVQHQLGTVKDQFYISLWRYNYTAITDLEQTKSTTASLGSNPGSSTGFSSASDLQASKGSSELFHSAGDSVKSKQDPTQDIQYIPPVMGASSTLGEPAAEFLERHRLDLISRVIMVDPILDDLREQGLLEHKQYDLLRREPSIRKKMYELLDIVSNWEDSSKKTLYTSLRAHNPSVIKDLKRADKQMTTGSNLPSSQIRSGSHSKRSTFARNDYLKDKEQEKSSLDVQSETGAYAPDIRSDESDWNCEGRAVQSETPNYAADNDYWNFGGRAIQSETPNYAADNDYWNFGGRERKHFVDEHCWDLIRRIIMVDPVIDDLQEKNLVTQEQYNTLMKLKTPQKKMIDLYGIVRFWTNLKKDQVYLALRQHNPAFIRVLEKSDQILKPGNRSKGSHYLKLTLDFETGSSAGEHFLDKNKSGLINVMSTVDPVVEDLRGEGLLTEQQYHNILLKETSREKMEEIYNISDSFDNVKKDKVYLALRTHNRSHIRVMEQICKPSISVSDHSGEVVAPRDILSDEEEEEEIDWETAGSALFPIICSVCTEIYKTPVTLICGHNFCLECIEKIWNNEDKDNTSCPICKRRFRKRPELNKNPVLCKISELCQLTSVKKTHERCTYCTSPITRRAVKQCLLCEAFLCEEHLKVHSKQAEHVMLDPSVSLKNRKCSIHKAVLEYYCSQDSACVCPHCCIVGEHKEHQVIPIGEAMEIKKDKLGDTEENPKPQNSEKSVEEIMEDEDIPFEEEEEEDVDYGSGLQEEHKNPRYVLLAGASYKAKNTGVEEIMEDEDIPFEEEQEEDVDYGSGLQEEDKYPRLVSGSIEFAIICCICMETYKNPVTLICGHNYCLECIDKTWNNQDSDDTSCPICRRKFKDRPELNKNLVLCQIAESCQSTSNKKTHECCTYCSFYQYPAVKLCLLCEAFLCEIHLNVHSKKAEHFLLEPSMSPKNRRCSIHHTVLEYYCSQDSTLVCAHCCINGEHRGHQVIPIREAMEIKKDNLRDNEEILKLKKSEIEKSIKICMQKVQEKTHNAPEEGTDVNEVQEISEILKLVQGGLSIEERQATLSVEDLILQLEAKRSHLTQCISHIEELCYETDPFLVLQDQEDYNL